MFKNQLQELAQRSCFNLPCYTCIREGPDHAPRFKATVSFNGEVFESTGYHTTLRQAEHAAAEVALSTLSNRGPTQFLAARILDETGVCKNLLQETAQRAGVSLPAYTTIRSGPKHLPLFKCVVEIGGRHFKGEPAKTKKQAEKNAATAAWSALNQSTSASRMPLPMVHTEVGENGETASASSFFIKDERSSYQHSLSHTQFATRSKAPITLRDRSWLSRDHNAGSGQCYSCAPSAAIGELPNFERNQGGFLFNQQPVKSPVESNHGLGQRFASGQKHSFCNPSHLADASFESPTLVHQGSGLYHPQASPSSYGGSSRQQGRRHQRRHSLSGMESPMLSREALAVSRASGGGNMLGRVMLHQQQQIRGLPYQSLSERFEFNRTSLLEELQQRDEEDDWFQGESTSSLVHPQSHSVTSMFHSQRDSMWRMPLQSQSERFELKTRQLSQLEEMHRRDEEEWLCGDNEGSGRHCREKSPDRHYGHREGWLQDEASLLEDSKILSYREGWLRGEALKHSLGEERGHGYGEGWFQHSKQFLETEGNPTLKLDHKHSYGYQEGWLNKERVGRIVEKDRSYSQGHMYSKDMQNEKSLYVTGPPSATSSVASPFSSLWSKSTQWWGSHMPTSTSSAAAAVASTLGLRPPRSAAPAVKVRQMVPVCSAPPPRHPDTPARRHPSHNDQPHVDNETEACQLFSKLRL